VVQAVDGVKRDAAGAVKRGNEEGDLLEAAGADEEFAGLRDEGLAGVAAGRGDPAGPEKAWLPPVPRYRWSLCSQGSGVPAEGSASLEDTPTVHAPPHSAYRKQTGREKWLAS